MILFFREIVEISLLKCPEIGTFKVGFVELSVFRRSQLFYKPVCPILHDVRRAMKCCYRDEVY